MAIDRKALRRVLRSRRRALSAVEQQRARLRLAEHLLRQAFFHRARHIGFYLANDGELDPFGLLRRAQALHKHCYLPVLHRRYLAMYFARYRVGDKLLPNRYAIPEPLPRIGRVSGETLDVVFLPLVGFDLSGNRLGMGGGFYDRTFAHHQYRQRPLLVGLAHECQRVERLPVQPWDVPLDAVATEERLYWVGKPGRRIFFPNG